MGGKEDLKKEKTRDIRTEKREEPYQNLHEKM